MRADIVIATSIRQSAKRDGRRRLFPSITNALFVGIKEKIQGKACNDAFFFGHGFILQNKNCPDKAVTVLRKPSQRIISAFHAGFFVPRIKLSDRRDIWKTVRTAADFLRSPPAQSCATKMVLQISSRTIGRVCEIA